MWRRGSLGRTRAEQLEAAPIPCGRWRKTSRIHETAVVEAGSEIGEGTLGLAPRPHPRRAHRSGRGASSARTCTSTRACTSARAARLQNNVSVYNGVTIGDDVFVGPSVTFTNDRIPRAFNTEWTVTPTHVLDGASIGRERDDRVRGDDRTIRDGCRRRHRHAQRGRLSAGRRHTGSASRLGRSRWQGRVARGRSALDRVRSERVVGTKPGECDRRCRQGRSTSLGTATASRCHPRFGCRRGRRAHSGLRRARRLPANARSATPTAPTLLVVDRTVGDSGPSQLIVPMVDALVWPRP